MNDGPGTTTTEALLATLRAATGHPQLEFHEPPTSLSGGFYAEMLRFRLDDAPSPLDGDLVARIVPDPVLGAWEGLIQREVTAQGFATPAVRLIATDASPLGRFLIVMDHVDGTPPIAGLSIRTIAGQIPNLVRRLPDQLAAVAASLHALDPEPLAQQLADLGLPISTTTGGFVAQQVALAEAVGQRELVDAGERLIAREPTSTKRVISHGDLHPFNILVTDEGPVLIDWTVARLAHPAFTLAFTDLMLSHPPIPLPRAGAAVLGPVGRGMAKRFLRRYQALAAPAGQVTEAELDWHRGVHSLRILVELARWDAAGTRPTHGHPWLVLEPTARAELGLAPT